MTTQIEQASQQRRRADSVSSIDRDLDWLIDAEQSDPVQSYKKEDYLQSPSSQEITQNRDVPEYHNEEKALQDEDTPKTYHEEQVLNGKDQSQTHDERGSTEDDQHLLELEIQKLKDEGFLPMDDPPEYDIADRVRQLNEELKAEDETPERTDRKVTFSDNVVAVEFPQELYSEDEGDAGPAKDGPDSSAGSDNTDAETPPAPEHTNPDDLQVTKLAIQDNDSNSNGDGSKVREETVLMERDGKFELVDVSRLSAVERRSMGLDVDVPPIRPDPSDRGDAPSHQETTASDPVPLQPSPPPRPRPSTATDKTGLNRSQLPPRRIQSAGAQREAMISWQVTYTGHSTYGLTPEQKDHKREQIRLRMRQQQEQKHTEEERAKRRQEEADSAFQAWLHQKRENELQQQRQTKKTQQKKDGGGNKDQPNTEEIFQDWLHAKQQQARRERKLKEEAEQEKINGFVVRDRKECNKAFRQWVQSKNDQFKKDRSMKRASATVTRQLARQSRKSRNITKALETAHIYRYTDWYGYRF